MAKSTNPNFDVSSVFDQAASQFRNLNASEPGQWPALPKWTAWVVAAVAVVVAGWFLLLSSTSADLDTARQQEPVLKADFRNRLGQAVNLGELRKQKLQVQEYVTQLEKQLPGRAEMDALLSDINQAGLGRGLQFELFRPGQVQIKDYYAELPIAIKVSGRYHDIGGFAAEVANLSRIVTLQNLSIGPVANKQDASGNLTMEATARTYRYLDPSEIADQQRREVKPSVTPLLPPKKFDPQPYTAAQAVEPFSNQKLSVALKQEARQPNSLLSAELNRRREPLEAYPLDSMSMVGSVNKQGKPFALLRVDNLLYQVKLGDYLGQNYGRISRIAETEISLREIVQDAAGEWIERPAVLQLVEKAR